MELMKVLHLGSRVLLGAEKKEGVVDALTQSSVAVVCDDGYRIVKWEDVSCAV